MASNCSEGAAQYRIFWNAVSIISFWLPAVLLSRPADWTNRPLLSG